MLAEGATSWWSAFNPESPRNGTDNQCAGAALSPSYFLIREVVGIRPVSPGARQVYFDPLLNATEWVQAQIPTMHGQVRVKWSFEEADRLEIVLDADYPLEVVPMLPPHLAAMATFHISDIVSVLQPDDLVLPKTAKEETDVGQKQHLLVRPIWLDKYATRAKVASSFTKFRTFFFFLQGAAHYVRDYPNWR